ncbi:MAG TPA: SCO family protein [Stellaceae bacterium]|nr:SCO family protein [Stellaceae bacterium]
MRRYSHYAVAFAALLGLFGIWLTGPWRSGGPRDGSATLQAPSIGGSFTLTATDGSTVTDQTYRGKIMLVYFGYTFCPDACPTTLNDIAAALAELGALADRIQALFITIDPQRDTRKVLADYAKSFDPRIVGLTGTPAQIAVAAKAYGVYYAPYKTADAPGGYLMDHTSVVFVMNEEGRFVATFTQDTPPAQMADRLRKLIAKTS